MEDNNQSSSSQSAPEPAIYKLVNPKTASLLRTSAKAREEAAKAAEMANEQTCVPIISQWSLLLLTSTYSFIAIKPDGVQVGGPSFLETA